MIDEPVKLTYEKIGGMLIGSDEAGLFYDCLFYERPVGRFKAFAGREFDLTMKDGSITHCNGQYWDGKSGEASKIKGINIISCTCGYIEDLKDCYVYCGRYADKDKLQELISDYNGKIYEYREYEQILKLDYEWYDVVIDGKKYPCKVNKKGQFIDSNTNEFLYGIRHNYCKMRYYKQDGKSFDLCLFKWQYKDDTGRLIKIERKMMDVLKESLPYSEEEIKKNCQIT